MSLRSGAHSGSVGPTRVVSRVSRFAAARKTRVSGRAGRPSSPEGSGDVIYARWHDSKTYYIYNTVIYPRVFTPPRNKGVGLLPVYPPNGAFARKCEIYRFREKPSDGTVDPNTSKQRGLDSTRRYPLPPRRYERLWRRRLAANDANEYWRL